MRVVMGSRRTPPTAKSSERTPPAPTTVVTIKQEAPEDDIKEYAETAMNELLGWYGYDKVDSRDTQGLNLHHFSAHQRSAGSDLDSSDSATSPSSSRGINRESPDPAGIPPGCSICAWCQKVCNNKQLFSLKTPNGQKNFCSEVCFTQCRRANFKRNKTCDWCRHVRHTVNYVDFQDGEHQLQFCSDKCLNQYKMNIFCRETQAHLQMHPHLQDGTGNGSGSGSGTLITPDLWMRDCRSESPSSDHSVSPVPPPPPPAVSPPPAESKEPTKSPRRSTRSKRIAVSTPAPSDLRMSCSPRSIESLSPPKNSSHPPTPVIHPPSHLLPPPRPPTPFLSHGLLPPLPGIFHNHRHSPNFPPIIRPPRTSPNTPNTTPATRPPPLLPLPLRPNRANQPPPIPPTQQQQQPPPPPPTSAIPSPLSRYMMPPVTVMVPYPIVLPLPIPIPIPIPLFLPKNNKLIPSPPPEEKPSLPPETAASENKNMPLPPVSKSPTATTEDTISKKSTLSDRPLRKRKRLEAQTEGENILKQKFVPA